MSTFILACAILAFLTAAVRLELSARRKVTVTRADETAAQFAAALVDLLHLDELAERERHLKQLWLCDIVDASVWKKAELELDNFVNERARRRGTVVSRSSILAMRESMLPAVDAEADTDMAGPGEVTRREKVVA